MSEIKSQRVRNGSCWTTQNVHKYHFLFIFCILLFFSRAMTRSLSPIRRSECVFVYLPASTNVSSPYRHFFVSCTYKSNELTHHQQWERMLQRAEKSEHFVWVYADEWVCVCVRNNSNYKLNIIMIVSPKCESERERGGWRGRGRECEYEYEYKSGKHKAQRGE